MKGPMKRVSRAEREAAEWHLRLGEPRVSTQTVQDFFEWRQDPENAAAYGRVETVWKGARAASGSPAVNRAVAEAMGRPRRRWLMTTGGAGLAGALVVVVAVTCAALWGSGRQVYRTDVGEQRVVELADGSTVRLDTDSVVRVRFERGRRGLDLVRGQALFTVAHDSTRPFVVTAGDAAVTAVGTVFDVRRTGDAARITLVSGAVSVQGSAGGPQKRLAAGEQAVLSRAGPVVRTVDAGSVTAWSEGRIVFRDRPLDEAVAEVNRYLDAPIVLDAPALSKASVNGVIRTGDRAAFVEVVAVTFDLKASRDADGRVRLTPENNSGRAPG
jgi:transmembrane sensor